MERLRRIHRRMHHPGNAALEDLADGPQQGLADAGGAAAVNGAGAMPLPPSPPASGGPPGGGTPASGPPHSQGSLPMHAPPRSTVDAGVQSSQCATSHQSGRDDDATSIEQRLPPGAHAAPQPLFLHLLSMNTFCLHLEPACTPNCCALRSVHFPGQSHPVITAPASVRTVGSVQSSSSRLIVVACTQLLAACRES